MGSSAAAGITRQRTSEDLELAVARICHPRQAYLRVITETDDVLERDACWSSIVRQANRVIDCRCGMRQSKGRMPLQVISKRHGDRAHERHREATVARETLG